jgi:hypothetical protein
MRVPQIFDIDNELWWYTFEQVVTVVVLVDVTFDVCTLRQDQVGVRQSRRSVDLDLAD